jgi:hypothetical protein
MHTECIQPFYGSVKLIEFGVFVSVLYQKRLKKERKARRRLQDQLELEMKRRSQYEDALKNSAAGDALRLINGKLLSSLLHKIIS